MSKELTNAMLYVSLEQKINAWYLELGTLMRAGHWPEKQKTLLFRIQQAQSRMRHITPNNISRELA